MDKIIERISWETTAIETGAGGLPLDIPNPVIRNVSFSHPIEQSAIDFAKTLGIEAKNIPSYNGQINRLVEFSIPMKVLRKAVVPALNREQQSQLIQNKLDRFEEENQIQEAYDRKHNLGGYSY